MINGVGSGGKVTQVGATTTDTRETAASTCDQRELHSYAKLHLFYIGVSITQPQKIGLIR